MIEAINKALSLSKDQDQGEEYSKFYYTHGRLLILSKEYEEGRDLINRALYTENKSNKSKLELYRNQLIKSDLIEFFHSSDLVEKEMKENPRSRSAKLRVDEKIMS